MDPKRLVSIVDDDEAVRGAVVKLLKLHGFAVRSFASAEEFLAAADFEATRCLIADVRMPGMTGLALQERLIAEGRRIPIIFVTAHPEERCRERALRLGAVCFLAKPFDGQTLIGSVEKALSGSLNA